MPSGYPNQINQGDVMAELIEYLKYMVEKDASDIYITVGVPAMFRIQGSTYPYDEPPLTADDTESIANKTMNDKQKK